MYKYLPFIISVLLITPLFVVAQTTTTTTDSEPLPQTFMLPAGTSTESVEHGEVTVDIGIARRFSESPQALADIDLTADRVINARRLQVFTRHLALSEPIHEMSIGDDEASVRMNGPAQLFGFIPVGVGYDVEAAFSDGELDEVATEKTAGWWSSLATKQQPEEISTEIRTEVENAQFMSTTQQQAVILEAIVNAVGNN